MWPADLVQVLVIEKICFGPDAWEAVDFRRCFVAQSPRLAHVAECAGRIVAYSACRMIDFRTVMVENLGVLPPFRRSGIAGQLLARIEAQLCGYTPERMRAVVRESNLPAQLLFRSAGWRAVGMLRRPWPDCDDDGIKFFKRVLSRSGRS
jgi:ribosomal-protein-alanine N-acetyltransferase